MTGLSRRPALALVAILLASPVLHAQNSAWTVLKEGLENKDLEDRTVAVHLLGTLTHDSQAADLAMFVGALKTLIFVCPTKVGDSVRLVEP